MRLVSRGRKMLENVFDLTDRHPEYVKIFVAEYDTDSPPVRNEIRDRAGIRPEFRGKVKMA